jgi:DNA-directed RNA polymerase subunit RPC12/RpoP
MFARIKCPKCGVEGSMSLIESSYRGPYRCWKCSSLFTLSLESGEVRSIEPLSQEEYQRQQELKDLKSKFKRG